MADAGTIAPGRFGRNAELKVRLIRWLLFSVLSGAIPVLFTFLSRFNRNQSTNTADLLGRGELALIGVAVALTAAGEAFVVVNQTRRPSCLVAGSFSMLLSVLAAWYYGDASGSSTTKTGSGLATEVDPDNIARGSLYIFFAIFAIGTFCILLSGPRQEND